MNKEIKKLLNDQCEKYGWETIENDSDLLLTLQGAKQVYREEIDQHRWYNQYQYVVQIDEVFIGYIYAEMTGDGDIGDSYDFRPETVCLMRPVEKTVINYEKIE